MWASDSILTEWSQKFTIESFLHHNNHVIHSQFTKDNKKTMIYCLVDVHTFIFHANKKNVLL